MTGIELKNIRLKMGITQKTMASLLGMKQQNYSRLETNYEGRKLTKQHISAINMLVFIHENELLTKYMTTNKAFNLTKTQGQFL